MLDIVGTDLLPPLGGEAFSCKSFEPNITLALHDILKLTLDLRLIKQAHITTLKNYIGILASDRRVFPSTLIHNVKVNMEMLRKYGRTYWVSHHYILVRREYELEKLVDEVEKELLSILHQLL